jgi:hypothetical protein
MLGRFLELAVATTDVLASLEFYHGLGFTQLEVGDARAHPYAVVTDGRLHIGLHGADIESPTLTWVHSDLAAHVGALESLGIEFSFARLGEDDYHELGFRDPAGQAVTIVEARTYSPPAGGTPSASRLGYFEEYAVPTTDMACQAAFWEKLGLVAFDPLREPIPRTVASHRDLNLGMYDIELPRPVLVFSDPDAASRAAELRDMGQRFVERVPRGLARSGGALLEAPEGTWLLVTAGLDG